MSCDVSTPLLCKNTFWPLEILSSTPTFPIWSSRHFCTTTHLNILQKNSSKCLEMSMDAYNSSSSKNPVLFFEKFEWINLFCILVQFDDLYSNHIFLCSSNPELFPTCSPPFKTLKSRRVDSLGVFKCML